jgi:uncharacterized protein (TIGR00369 family)
VNRAGEEQKPRSGAAGKPTKWLANFDSEIADGLMAAQEKAVGGLPMFLGVRFSDFSPGRLRAEMQVKSDLLAPIGNLHGGALAALCDHLLGCVCYPHMKPGQWATTIECKVEYFVPVSDGVATAEAEIVSCTQQTAAVRISVENEGRVVCVAEGAVLILDAER